MLALLVRSLFCLDKKKINLKNINIFHLQCIRRAKDISPKMMSCEGLYRQKPQRLCIMSKRKHTFFQAQIISHPIPYLRLVRGFSGYMQCFVFSNRGAVNYSQTSPLSLQVLWFVQMQLSKPKLCCYSER